jgi:hypothetical protein
MAKSIPKTCCRTPTPGRKPTNIPTWKFEKLRKAILRHTPKVPPGVAFVELFDRVAEEFSEEETAEIGSISWHVTTVKLEMEVRGELQRVAQSTPQRLIRRV